MISAAGIVLQSGTDYLDYVEEMLQKYENLGPLPGLFLPFMEAFLPFLPLFVFVLANGAAYGLLKGFLYSWVGASLGSISVFIVVRKMEQTKLVRKIKSNRHVRRVMKVVDRRGFGLLFILLCFPFSPSAIINVVAGLSNIKLKPFALAVLLGKAVMIFSIAYIGSSIVEFYRNPVKTIIIILCISVFWMLGKFIEKRFIKY